MQESTILKIALICSVTGLVALFFLLRTVEPDRIMIGKLDQAIDETVMLDGIVLGVSGTESVTFLMLEKSEMTTIVFFGPLPLIETGDYVQIKGTVVEDEEGGSEIIGEEVRVI